MGGALIEQDPTDPKVIRTQLQPVRLAQCPNQAQVQELEDLQKLKISDGVPVIDYPKPESAFQLVAR